MKKLVFAFAVAFPLVASGLVAAEPASFHAAAARAVSAAPPTHSARYSFVDVYRLTMAGAMAEEPLPGVAPDAPLRVAMAPAAEARFSIAPMRQPEKWLLVLAGLALAGWVAHRRLTQAL
jgi:hypothetical protein